MFTEPPQQGVIDKLVNETHIVQDYFHVRISGCTGYQNTSVLMGELDAPLNLGWGDD